MFESKAQKAGILSLRGRDTAGIAALGSALLTDNGANITEESAQVVGGKYFCEMFVFRVAAKRMAKIKAQAKRQLRSYQPCVVEIDDFDATAPKEDGREAVATGSLTPPYLMQVTALDQPGISSRIENTLSDMGINMREVRGIAFRPHGNERQMYRGSFRLEIPNSEIVRQLRRRLRELEDEYGWDIDFYQEGTSGHRMEVVLLDAPRKTSNTAMHAMAAN